MRSNLEEHWWTTRVDKYNRRRPYAGPWSASILLLSFSPPSPFSSFFFILFLLSRRHFANTASHRVSFRHSVGKFRRNFYLRKIRFSSLCRGFGTCISYRPYKPGLSSFIIETSDVDCRATTCIHLSIAVLPITRFYRESRQEGRFLQSSDCCTSCSPVYVIRNPPRFIIFVKKNYCSDYFSFFFFSKKIPA